MKRRDKGYRTLGEIMSGQGRLVPVLACLTALLLSSAAGQSKLRGGDDDILGALEKSGHFTTLLAAFREADLGETLRGHGPFTLFAPTDDAFARMPKAKLDALLKDKAQLQNILLYHLVLGRYSLREALNKRAVKTYQGRQVHIAQKGKNIAVDIAVVITPDIFAANGVVHTIDMVLTPPAPENYR